MSRRRVTQRQARAHRRPPAGNRLVSVHGNTYEVHDIPGGGQKIFRLELELVPADSPEANLVRSQMLYEDEPVTPDGARRVRPHRPGGGSHV